MNCPTCAAPNVMLHKDIWECGWCGDSGPIPRRILEQRKAVREKQEVWWQEAAATARWAAQTITESAAELLPGRKDAKSLAWKAILCQVSTGLIESGLWNGTWGDKAEQAVSGRIFYPYRALANDLADSSGISNSATIEKAVRTRTPLFQAEGQLTDKVCGKFWEMMIEQLPPYDKEEPSMQDGDLYMNRGFGVGNSAERAIEKILCSLLPLASLFAGDEGDTRDTAPWPPEKTKRVLEILSKPQESVKKEPAAPKPQQVEDETANPKVSPVTEEAPPTSGTDTTPVAETPQETAPPKERKFVPALVAVAVVLAMVVGGILLNRHSQAKRLAAWEQQYQTAAALFAESRYKEAADLAEDVPENIAEQPALLTVAKAGVALNTNTEDALRGGIDLLKNAEDLGSYQKQGDKLLAELTNQLHASIYRKSILRLRQKEPYIARPYLEELDNYKDAPTLLVYAEALSLAQQFNAASYKQALALLQTIPAEHDGELAAEIADLRDDLPDMIAKREEFEAQLAAYQAQQQKPKPPQTFNYGSSTDTGPGSGHSLREDYGDPEDLYEDGDYDDLDEAWDEWEEGW